MLARSQIVTCGADTFVKVFEADNLAAEPRTIEHHDSPVTTLAIHRKGTYLATGTEAHMVQYFGFPSCELLKNLTRAQSPIQHIAFDPKGRNVAVGGDDGVIRLVNCATAQYATLKGHSDSVLCVAFDPKGEFFASSSADGTIKIWDVTDEPAAIKTIRVTTKVAPGSAQRLRVAWHPTGSSIAIPFSSGVHILERGTWNPTSMLLNGHSKEVSLVAWSPNGQYLATGGLDKQIFLWQLNIADSLDRYRADSVPNDLMWSPKDNALAFLDENGQLGLWNAPVPAHLPSPTSDPQGAAQAAANAQAAADAAVAGGAATGGASASAATGNSASGAAVATGGGATVFSMEDDDDFLDEASASKPDGEGGAGSAGPKRRLRKVQHDSDDGGFSDHDDDEAAEAAMLAREIAKRSAQGGAGGGVAAGPGLASAGIASSTKLPGNLAAALSGLTAGAGAASAPIQGVVHPSATPAKNGRRFLLWNMTGMVLSRDENVFSAIEVEFNSIEKHRPIRLTDHYSFSMAALDDAAVMFASKSNNGNPSTIVYRPLASWAPNSEWQIQLDHGEEALAIAVGHKFAAIATSKRYLRLLSHTGAQRALISVANPLVALAASGGMLAVVQHAGRAAEAQDQSLLLALYDVRDTARPVRISVGPLPLSEGASLDWVGFSESGVLCTVDTAGIVRGCLRSYSFEWAPLLDCNAHKKAKNEHHWIVGLTDKELICVMCKGEDKYPPTLPRPVTTPLQLGMPLACADATDPNVEKERLLSAVLLNEFRAGAVDDGCDQDESVQKKLLAGFTRLDSLNMKLLNAAMKGERMARALDLAAQLQLPKSLSGALRLANHYKLGPLAERIARLMETRFEDGDDEVDVEEAPAQTVNHIGQKPKALPAVPAKAEDKGSAGEGNSHNNAPQQEEEADDEMDDGEGGENAAPQSKPAANPFAKNAAGSTTTKGPKRSLPVTAPVGGNKMMKK